MTNWQHTSFLLQRNWEPVQEDQDHREGLTEWTLDSGAEIWTGFNAALAGLREAGWEVLSVTPESWYIPRIGGGGNAFVDSYRVLCRREAVS